MSSLRAALIFRQLQRLFVLWLVIWMALFAPAVCQYHGLLVRAHTQLHGHDLTAAQGSRITSDPFDFLCGISLQAHTPAQASSTTSSVVSSVVDHQPLSSNTLMLISLLMLALPALLLGYFQPEIRISLRQRDLRPLQHIQWVLTPPPR